MLLDDLCVLSVSIQLPQPFKLLCSLLCGRFFGSDSAGVMERLEFGISLHLGLVDLRQDLIVDGSPAVVLKSHVPPIVLVVLRLVEMNVDGLFTHVFF